MADFVQDSQTKSAIRELATPIASVAAFNLIGSYVSFMRVELIKNPVKIL